MDWGELQQFWSIPTSWSVLPIIQGVNNLTQIIETPAGSYILRIYRSDRSLDQIRYELGVLKSLRELSRAFSVLIEGHSFGLAWTTHARPNPALGSNEAASMAKAWRSAGAVQD